MTSTQTNKPRILLLDIETAPSLGLYFDLWKEGNIVSREKDWYILSFAAKWLGDRLVSCHGLPDFTGYKKNPEDDKTLCKALATVLSQADVIVAHNGDGFDFPKINARLIKHGIQPPTPYKTIDTLKVAKRYFAFESNRLKDLAIYLNAGAKMETGGIGLWKGCMSGDKKSWETMKKYNVQDVLVLEKIYLALRPWMTNHPNMGLLLDKPQCCPICGKAGSLQRRGFTYSRIGKKARYQCADGCGGWSTGESIKTQIKIR